jgi:putative spermidine/putrescine transport system ATP-binding protein
MTTDKLDVEVYGAYKKMGPNVVLDHVDFNVKQGELLTLLGPSGCGKTTTLNLISGFIESDKGDVYIKGKKVNGIPPHKRDLGMVFQSYSLFPHMTVYENLNFGLKLRKVHAEDKKRRIDSALDLVKMKGLEHRYPRELSGGQRQRVAIARALVVEPKLLLLDEPLSNLDAKLRQELRAEIKRMQKEVGVTTIFVTHDQEEALSMSDRIIVMNNGKIEQIGTPTEIYQSPKTEFVFQFIGKSNRLNGVVKSIESDIIRLQVNDLVISVEKNNRMDTHQSTNVDDEVKLYIRPEKIRILASPSSELSLNSCKGKILQMNYLGSFWEIEVSALGTLMHIISPTIEPNWMIGSEVDMDWNVTDIKMVKK